MTSITLPSATDEKAQVEKAVKAVANQIRSRKPGVAGNESREDIYRAIFINVLNETREKLAPESATTIKVDEHNQGQEDRKNAIQAGARFGMQNYDSVERLCHEYDTKLLGAATLLVCDNELAQEAMAGYVTMRMNDPEASELTPEKRATYRKVRKELLDLVEQARLSNNLPVGEHKNSGGAVRITLRT